MTRRVVRAISLQMAVAALICTGCGGASAGDVIAHANALCRHQTQQIASSSRDRSPLGVKLRTGAAVAEKTNAALRALDLTKTAKIPPEFVDQRERATAALRLLLKRPGSSATKAANRAVFQASEAARRIASSHGLGACARS